MSTRSATIIRQTTYWGEQAEIATSGLSMWRSRMRLVKFCPNCGRKVVSDD